MNKEEKIALLEDMLEVDEGTLSEESVLDELEEWDSVASVSLIVLMQDEFDKRMTARDVKAFVTVKDILDAME